MTVTSLAALVSALLLLPTLRPSAAAAQIAVLRITVTILDGEGRPRPVPRHALLISDNPATAAPERVVTAADGTAELRLRPGNYTVESDEPLMVQGKSYQWMRTLDVAAGRDTVLALDAANAQVDVAPAGAPAAAPGAAGIASASALLLDWQASVVTIWSPTRLGCGFLADARGMIVTNQRLVGDASLVEVQLSSLTKIPARVLAADVDRNVAVLWIEPASAAPARAMTLAYGQEGKAAVAVADRLHAISARAAGPRRVASGAVSRVDVHTLISDVPIDEDCAGAPLLDAAGRIVAITTAGDDRSEPSAVSSRAVRIDEARGVIAVAEKKMQGAPPGGTLPVEPSRPYEDDALRDVVQRRAGSLAAYRVAAADFDVHIVTPVLLYGARHRGDRDRDGGRERAAGGGPAETQPSLRALQDFANWDDYAGRFPPVVMIRVTPKLVEGFWTTVARGAAQTQGVSLPPVRRVKTAFGHLRVSCGAAEVVPIHPLRIEQRLSETNVIYEGLYVFDPDAIGPRCGTVTLSLFSAKHPATPDVRVIDAKVVQQVWQDFAPYRAAAR